MENHGAMLNLIKNCGYHTYGSLFKLTLLGDGIFTSFFISFLNRNYFQYSNNILENQKGDNGTLKIASFSTYPVIFKIVFLFHEFKNSSDHFHKYNNCNCKLNHNNAYQYGSNPISTGVTRLWEQVPPEILQKSQEKPINGVQNDENFYLFEKEHFSSLKRASTALWVSAWE